MSDAAHDRDRSADRSGSPLPSARDIAAPPSPAAGTDAGPAGRPGRGRGGRRDRSPHGKPRPARDMVRPDVAPPVEPEEEVAELEVDGAKWSVRVLGLSGSAPGGRAAPLLLLGFTPAGALFPGAVEREALVVGRSLEALSESTLEQAFRVSRTSTASDGKRG